MSRPIPYAHTIRRPAGYMPFPLRNRTLSAGCSPSVLSLRLSPVFLLPAPVLKDPPAGAFQPGRRHNGDDIARFSPGYSFQATGQGLDPAVRLPQIVPCPRRQPGEQRGAPEQPSRQPGKNRARHSHRPDAGRRFPSQSEHPSHYGTSPGISRFPLRRKLTYVRWS